MVSRNYAPFFYNVGSTAAWPLLFYRDRPRTRTLFSFRKPLSSQPNLNIRAALNGALNIGNLMFFMEWGRLGRDDFGDERIESRAALQWLSLIHI